MGSSDEFIAEIAAGALDVAFLGLPESATPEGVSSRVLARDRLVAAVSHTHPFADRERLTLAEVAHESFIDFLAGSPGRAQSDITFAGAGLTREVRLETMSAELMLDLVAENHGIALLSPRVLVDRHETRAIPVVDGPTRAEHLA
ncbi:LysR substrate-binding domain-containing protein [Microbacterium amylolyticum]|uniref:DNA-binding transcriptional LysR family regulator n=1 Tax=Microbacterium amylolyticum TaxID=936337 RepID=A0ABS4ZF03_9MICO|nr:LysR substrate-binding domain-containing protein [Microbacterium amylolyticum]MBP2435867.1 DNA-binding transcriptional LysR family regulator [Microbacterium amylolyticum]